MSRSFIEYLIIIIYI